MSKTKYHHLSVFFLLLVCGFGAIDVFVEQHWPTLVAVTALLGFLLLEWRRLTFSAQFLCAAALLLIAALLFQDKLQSEAMYKAARQATFLSFFVLSLASLQDAAMSSPLVQRSGFILQKQQPGRRYIVFSIGGAVLSVLLSLGTISLLGALIAQSTQGQSDARIAEIKEKRISLATLRGFATSPLFSPTSIAIPIVLAIVPELTWLQIAAHGVPIVVILICAGWILDRLSYPAVPRRRPDGESQPIAPLMQLAGLCVLIPSIAAIAGYILNVNLITALLLIAPLLSVAWFAVQAKVRSAREGVQIGMRQLVDRTVPKLPDYRSEVAIFAASGALGLLLLPLVDMDALSAFVMEQGFSKYSVMAIGFASIVGSSLIGLNPIVGVSLVVGILVGMPDLGLSPIQIGMTGLYGWMMTVGLSPFSATVRLLAKALQREPITIGIYWNGRYALMASLPVLLLCFL